MVITLMHYPRLQHYKDRQAPWVKVHRDWLNHQGFTSLDLASLGLLTLLWVLGTKANGVIMGTSTEISFWLRMDTFHGNMLTPLIDAGFLSVAYDEGEEVDVRPAKGKAKRQPRGSKKHIARPDGVTEQTWKDFLAVRDAKKAPFTQTALDRMLPEVERAGKTLEQALQLCCIRGWQGFRADWCTKEDYYA